LLRFIQIKEIEELNQEVEKLRIEKGKKDTQLSKFFFPFLSSHQQIIFCPNLQSARVDTKNT
jgi:hypothetical protein